jgi:hypothetical protein
MHLEKTPSGTHTHSRAHTRTHTHARTHMHTHMHTLGCTHASTHLQHLENRLELPWGSALPPIGQWGTALQGVQAQQRGARIEEEGVLAILPVLLHEPVVCIWRLNRQFSLQKYWCGGAGRRIQNGNQTAMPLRTSSSAMAPASSSPLAAPRASTAEPSSPTTLTQHCFSASRETSCPGGGEYSVNTQGYGKVARR